MFAELSFIYEVLSSEQYDDGVCAGEMYCLSNLKLFQTVRLFTTETCLFYFKYLLYL